MISNLKIKITVFTSGFVLMVFELVGTRVLAPFLGSSSVVWTSVIGVILSFMSLGYWYGGKIADKYSSTKTLALVISFTAISILAMNLGKNSFLKLVSSLDLSLISKSLITSSFLFSVPSFLLAFVSPFAIRLSLQNIKNSGSISGNIYALSTIGSIIGTFCSGFFLISFFGTNQILWILSLVLLFIAGLISIPTLKSKGIWILILVSGNIYYSVKGKDYIDIDTNYSRIFITQDEFQDKETKFLTIDGYVNSAMYIHQPTELTFKYTQFYDVFEYFKPDYQTTVMFGGAGFSYPKHFQEKFTNKALDIIEIDPELTLLAKKEFEFKPAKNTRVIHQDARYFLAQTQHKYDVVLYDVLTSNLTIPFHLTTQEAFADIFNIMSDDGVLILNLIGDIEGKGANFLKSEFKTLDQIFSEVLIFSAQKKELKGLNNVMMIALKKRINFSTLSSNSPFYHLLQNQIHFESVDDAIVLTDNFSPANYLIRSN